MTVAELAATAAAEIRTAIAGVDERAVLALCERIRAANAIATYAVGREGLVLRGFAMRLYHLGFPAFVTGDMTARPLGPGGLLVCSAGPGSFSTVSALSGVARNAGAAVVLFTAQPQTDFATSVDLVVHLPAQTMAGGPASQQLMGSLYEQALWVLGDALVDQLVVVGQLDRAAIVQRHTNLE